MYHQTPVRLPSLFLTSCYRVPTVPSREVEYFEQELIIVYLDPPIVVDIESPERLRELLDRDTRADETIKVDAGWVTPAVSKGS